MFYTVIFLQKYLDILRFLLKIEANGTHRKWHQIVVVMRWHS